MAYSSPDAGFSSFSSSNKPGAERRAYRSWIFGFLLNLIIIPCNFSVPLDVLPCVVWGLGVLLLLLVVMVLIIPNAPQQPSSAVRLIAGSHVRDLKSQIMLPNIQGILTQSYIKTSSELIVLSYLDQD